MKPREESERDKSCSRGERETTSRCKRSMDGVYGATRGRPKRRQNNARTKAGRKEARKVESKQASGVGELNNTRRRGARASVVRRSLAYTWHTGHAAADARSGKLFKSLHSVPLYGDKATDVLYESYKRKVELHFHVSGALHRTLFAYKCTDTFSQRVLFV